MSNRKVVQATIGTVNFLVDSSVDPSQYEATESDSGIRQTSPTFPSLTSIARANLIEVMDQLRSEFHKHWEGAMGSVSGPAEMSLEVSFAFESGINAWVIVGKGSAGVKVAFKWTRAEK